MFHWNLQETPDPTNPFDSFLVKALLSSIVSLEITILGNGTLAKPGICHLQRRGLGGTWKLSEYIYAGPGLFFALRLKLEELCMCIAFSKTILLFFISFNAESIRIMV